LQNGYYRIEHSFTGRCLDVEGCQNTDGAKVQFYERNDTDAQQWRFTLVDETDEDNPVFYLSPKCASERALDIGDAPEERLIIRQADRTNIRQLFRVWKVTQQQHIKDTASPEKAEEQALIDSCTEVGQIVRFADRDWRVLNLDKTNHRALVITKDIIEMRFYHESYDDITWEYCTLRSYLNNQFFQSLPAHIKSRVIEVINQNPDNPQYGTAGGSPTRDKVFLLSIDEANGYFKDDNDRCAKYDGSDIWWWLRSPGNYAFNAARVVNDGSVHAGGNDNNVGVRPALWLNL
jgi:hypothetical protein